MPRPSSLPPALPISGILLCAGGGRRMGKPKARVRFGPTTLLDRAAQILAKVAVEVLVPGDIPVPVPPSCRPLPDATGVRGPIAGLIAGLNAATHSPCVALACDLPLVPPELLAFLAYRCAEGYLAAVPFAGGRLHTLCAAYSRDILPAMSRWVRLGHFSTCELLRTLDTRVCVVDEQALRQFGDPEVMLLNVNAPSDLRRAEKFLSSA